MITRKDYMLDSANLHHSYYLQFATEHTYSLIKAFVGKRDYESIRLHDWDRISEAVKASVDRTLLGRVEGYECSKYPWSLNTSICIAKAVARELAP